MSTPDDYSGRPDAGQRWGDFFKLEWARQVSGDNQGFDNELIAAYAEGLLTDEEKISAERVLAESPAALEMLIVLKSHLADSHRPLAENRWRQVFEESWDQAVSTEPAEFDAELIAVYAEGNATEEERQLAERLLADNPAALELLIVLRQQLTESIAPLSEGSPAESAQSERNTAGPAVTPASVVSPRKSSVRRFAPWLITAASVVVTIGATTWSLNQRSENASLSQQVAALDRQAVSQAMAIAMSQQERMIKTSASVVPPYAIGETSVSFLRTVLAESKTIQRGVSDQDPPEIRGSKEATLMSASTMLDQWQAASNGSKTSGVLIAQASLEISLSKLDAAAATINQLADQLGESAPDVRNLRAVYLLAFAETQPMTDAGKSFQEAGEILAGLTTTHPGFPNGWLNLALYRERHGGSDAAIREAWDRYLQLETREDVKAAIRSFLETRRP